jgi:hypothetical protein
MSSVVVSSYSRIHSVTYVADNMLKSLKDVIVQSGLDPSKLVDDWEVLSRGLKAWIAAEQLERVILEVFDPRTNALVGRWDIDVSYSWTGGDGQFWVDSDQIRHAVRKQGMWPAEARYRVVVTRKPWSVEVDGWSDTTLRSTSGMVHQSLGGTIEHNGLGASAAYWRKG